jgi:hypothetical protein
MSLFSRLSVRFVVLSLVVGGVWIVESPSEARAITGSEFVAGNLISDSLFYNSGAMTQDEIQAFLNSKISTCSNGACLNVLITDVASRPRRVSSRTGNVICEAFTGGSLSAAAIIYRTQVACGISAKVILVTLQKEQGLVTSAAPTQNALDKAMGMGCPDSAACAVQYLGFGNQVFEGAAQLKAYKASQIFKQPGANSIAYHPIAACGSANVYIENYATAALYNYTPYQPNAAALANLTGMGDSCSSYGNRNFWVFYNNWFGSPYGLPIDATDTRALVYARDSSGALWIYPSNGAGSWLPRLKVGDAWGEGLSTAFGAGDFNGDGHRDILAIDAAGVLWLYRSDGRLEWLPPIQVSSGWETATSVFSAGDFNGDGTQDLFSVDAAGLLWLHANDGHGVLAPAVQVGRGWGMFTAIFSPGDFTGDGNSDVIARDAGGGLWLYPGNGRSSWLAPWKIGTGWNGMSVIFSPGDFTGDGKVDVLARDASGGLWLYAGNGWGSWLGSARIGNGWGGMTAIFGPGVVSAGTRVDQPGVGDLNGDKARDVLARDTTGVLRLYPGSGRGSWSGSPTVLAGSWQGMTSMFGNGDFNRDGAQDLITVDGAGTMWLFASNRQGDYLAGVEVSTGWTTMNAIFGAGDFDGDSYPDILSRDAEGRLWLNPGDGAGGLLPAEQIGIGWGGMTAIFGAGDFDGDKNQDVLARDQAGNLWLYPGDGKGSWKTPKRVGWGWQGMTWVYSPGDFTGDSEPDVLARDAAGNLWLYPGNGLGGWVPYYSRIGSGWGGMSWIG